MLRRMNDEFHGGRMARRIDMSGVRKKKSSAIFTMVSSKRYKHKHLTGQEIAEC